MRRFLLLDELVYADQWDLWLKTLYDDGRPMRLVATSSATAALRGRRVESGVGRRSEHFLMPYLFSEYLGLLDRPVDVDVGPTLTDTLNRLPRVAPPTDLETLRRRFLLLGGFPELIARDRDIPQSFGIDHPMLLERLLYILAGQVTGFCRQATSALRADLPGLPTLQLVRQ